MKMIGISHKDVKIIIYIAVISILAFIGGFLSVIDPA